MFGAKQEMPLKWNLKMKLNFITNNLIDTKKGDIVFISP